MAHRRGERAQKVVNRWDRVVESMTAEPRRQLIVALLDASPGVSVELPEAAINPNVPTDPESLRIELCHQHLPKLAEMGFIEWDTEPLRATRGPRFEEVGVVVEAVHRSAGELPDSLVSGYQRLETERRLSSTN
ncbi:hypothetical protein [Halobellus captivus]|uniref:hypothetical protein n=1 Tax=Halobellus captivus TaxID=2592614 RepID=UPI0011A9F60D|nr:hypothetical protein [Halobellus captivus]